MARKVRADYVQVNTTPEMESSAAFFSTGSRSSGRSTARRRARWLPRPRQVTRLLVYLAFAGLFIFLGRRSNQQDAVESGIVLPERSSSNLSTPIIDYSWGSLIHRFHNHPAPATPRKALPWKASPLPAAHQLKSSRVQTLIVTSELAGLHKNGGIGTAFSELAVALAASGKVNVSILVAHPPSIFPIKQRQGLAKTLSNQGISLLFVKEEELPFFPAAWTPLASRRIHIFLKEHDNQWDVIHFPDNTGIGYFSIVARHQGLMLQNTRIVVGSHGADVEWAAMLNKRYPVDNYAIQLGEFEKASTEFADVVVAPSEYMLEYLTRKGWKMPEHALVIPNIVAAPPLRLGENATAYSRDTITPIKEIVFFGRLEERKGTRLFVEALELMFEENSTYATPHSINMITFLGRDANDPSTHLESSVLISQALQVLKRNSVIEFEFQFLKNYDRDQALAYIVDPSRLVVLPALADNSPSTVLECIAYSARFIASSVGGIPELVHPDDHRRVLFSPRAAPFARKILEEVKSLEKEPWPSIRPRPETVTAAKDWVDLHNWILSVPSLDQRRALTRGSNIEAEPLISVVITHYERTNLVTQMLDSLINQTYQNFELILVDDGSTSNTTIRALLELESKYFNRPKWQLVRIENSYLGEARNRGAALAKGSWLMFLDDDDVLKPHALRTLVDVSKRTGARALSSWLDEFATDANPLFATKKIPHRRTYWFLGSSLGVGMMLNSFGSGNIFVQKEVFEDIGGFSTFREVGAEDWQFYVRLRLKGYEHVCVAEDLIFVRSDQARASMKFSMDPWDAKFHALAPILADSRIQELGLAHALMFAKGSMDLEPPSWKFADSNADFEVVQGWRGWTYSFEPAGQFPGLEEQHHAEVIDDKNWGVDAAPSNPHINIVSQKPYITTRGERFSAARTFTAPREMTVKIEMTMRAIHDCGDGTEVTFASRIEIGDPWTIHAKVKTMDSGAEDVGVSLSLQRGSLVSVWVDPLETDECDFVEVRMTVTPVEIDNKAWSRIAKRQEQEAFARDRLAHYEREQAFQDSMKSPEATSDAEAEDEADEAPLPGHWAVTTEQDFFHIALIFDENRVEQALQVIRSAIKYMTSRKTIHFHLIAPGDLQEDLRQFASGSAHIISTYNHEMCANLVAPVLPFSNEKIHISAHCKMFLSTILDSIDQVLYLDTDTTILSDIGSCYTEPSDKSVLLKMAVDMGDVCQLRPDTCWPIGLHWRVPEGLECGNLADRNFPGIFEGGGRCPSTGDLETIQVNGGVAFMQLNRMREIRFTDRYIKAIAKTYSAVGRTARWGEQDFINSYFRLHPEDLELLPCGCNYQWNGRRKEVKCGNQPIVIAHHWSMGIQFRSGEVFNNVFYAFMDSNATATDALTIDPPAFPTITDTDPASPELAHLDVIVDPNCPLQAHDCSSRASSPSAYGKPAFVLTRVKSNAFLPEHYESFDSQHYRPKHHFVAAPKGLSLPSVGFSREVLDVEYDIPSDIKRLCQSCGHLAALVPGSNTTGSCTVPPANAEARKRYWDCACRVEDSTSSSMYDLDAVALDVGVAGWILYLDSDKIFFSPHSLAQLMAHAEDEKDLLVFRSDMSSISNEHELDYRNKSMLRSELDGVGFLFHSSHLITSEWADTRCSRSSALARLSQHLRLKWIALMPTTIHPLRRHVLTLESPAPDPFNLSIVVLETTGGLPTWTAGLLTPLQGEFAADMSVLTAHEDEPRSLPPNVSVVHSKAGSGLADVAKLGSFERILITTDTVRLQPAAITALLTYSLDEPDRMIGIFTETHGNAFSEPLDVDPHTFQGVFEQSGIPGLHYYSHLLPRGLIVSRSHLRTLSTMHDSSPILPRCHPVLLSAIAYNVSNLPPLRILPPPETVVDRVYDCRSANWPDITHNFLPGDSEPPTIEQMEDPKFNFEEPTLDECFAIVNERMGWKKWPVWGDQTGTSGPLGARLKVVDAETIEDERWIAALKREKCERNASERKQFEDHEEESDEFDETEEVVGFEGRPEI